MCIATRLVTSSLSTQIASAIPADSISSVVEKIGTYLFSNKTADGICSIDSPEKALFLKERMDIALPKNFEAQNLYLALFPLHRKIESLYRHLPWPDRIQKIAIVTQVIGGRGDASAAAKAIDSVRDMCPKCTFDWILIGGIPGKDPRSYLSGEDHSKVNVRQWRSPSPDESPADLLVTGPVKDDWGINYIESRIGRKVDGHTAFGFHENGECWPGWDWTRLPDKAKEGTDLEETYRTKLHALIFPPGNPGEGRAGLIQMGLHPGSGVFLDRSRIEAPLSRGYCCASYLLQIQDASLRKDVLEAMDVFDNQSQPDYDQHSFNSGYAHHSVSWGKFIDSVAIHERDKHVVIILNQKGQFEKLSTEKFRDQIFTPERLAFLKQKGYGTITLKGDGQETLVLQKSEYPQEERRLSVIVRPSFIPNDMKQLQLASERLLATGDNSAAEAWASRCKLYLYENFGLKGEFLQQQVDLAKSISPNLAKLLALFADGKIIGEHKPLNEEKMAELERLLNDPNLSDATIKFCNQIIQNYSFKELLEGGIKRTVWHRMIPELAGIEADALDPEFRTGLVSYLKNPNKKTLTVEELPELRRRVEEAVQDFLWPCVTEL